MDIKVDGNVIYMKGPRNPANPQPTPEEVDGLVTGLLKAVGGEGSLSDTEKAEFDALHTAQKAEMACKEISVQYCPSCTFNLKAEWFCKKLGDKLKDGAPGVKFSGEHSEQKGYMDIKVDGNIIYMKGPPNPENPQPTPEEVEGLVAGILGAAGVMGGLSEEEKEEFKALHEEQKSKM
mmetsp:Transcript_104628/g.223622  ORF Transcript_104628/g.223622 Transcript_104628/m.223622 type:complete len:178 (+) Transcript_104628:221-754(+)